MVLCHSCHPTVDSAAKRRALIGQQVDPRVDFYESCDVVEWKTKKPILGRVVI